MDYRNGRRIGRGDVRQRRAGLRRPLQRAGHATAEGGLTIATRGVKRVYLAKNGDVTVGMGRALLPEGDVVVSVDGRAAGPRGT